MNIHKFILAATAIIMSASCGNQHPDWSERRTAEESAAQGYMASARKHLQNTSYNSARADIKKMRESCPYAIEARRSAILLMDSIDLMEAQNALEKTDALLQTSPTDSLQAYFDELCGKVKFYHRKLEHDKKMQSAKAKDQQPAS